MKINEYDYYNDIANWSFENINYTEEVFTNWIYEEEIKKRTTKKTKILDLGTAAGEKILKFFPECAEILGTDYSKDMIESANKNLIESGRKNIKFRVMDNLKMDTPDNYFDLVTARHTVIEPKQIYKTLKKGGQLIVRGVDKLDCWSLKLLFGRGQCFNDIKSISQKDYEAIISAGFKNVELIPLHVIEYYKTKEDLYALLKKAPILDDFSEESNQEHEIKPIDLEILEQYIKENTTSKGIKLIRRYYAIIAVK